MIHLLTGSNAHGLHCFCFTIDIGFLHKLHFALNRTSHIEIGPDKLLCLGCTCN
uniref:Uncharacterized protein n=1 Tax=Rhizophora mucronata TaxID=61149 RepID=A0A2P2NLA0_RHIMU